MHNYFLCFFQNVEKFSPEFFQIVTTMKYTLCNLDHYLGKNSICKWVKIGSNFMFILKNLKIKYVNLVYANRC